MTDVTIKIDLEHQETLQTHHTGMFSRRELFETRVNSSKAIEACEHTTGNLGFSDVHHSYEMMEDFAEGGLGKLNIAKDKILKRFVAVKSLKDEFKEHPQLPLDFISEAQITAQLDHPSIVPIYSLNTDNRQGLHFAMKLVNGRTMRECIDDAVLNYKQTGCSTRKEIKGSVERLHWFIKVCDAVSFAHSRGVLHRDLKPDNIMVGEFGEVYVMDWGIAQLKEEDATMRHPRSDSERPGSNSTKIDGTPGYLAPELLYGAKFSNQTDLFALGMILFELVFLKTGVSGNSVKEILEKLKNGEFENFNHRFSSCNVPIDLKAVIAKAVHPLAEKRYSDVTQLATDVRAYLAHEEVSARPDNALRKVIRWTFNHKLQTFSFFMLAMFAAASVTTASLYLRMKESQESKRRELALTNYQGRVANVAHRIDQNLQHLKDMLENLAAQAAFLLKNPGSYPGKIYETKNFNASDYQFSPVYNRKISLNSPGMIVPPGASLQAQALLPLDQEFLRMLQHSSIITPPALDKLRETELPLKWVYVGLENGLFVSYPGKDGYSPNYDPRNRPWYKMGKEYMKTAWGQPYLDISGQGLVLPCVSPVFGTDRKLLGIAGLDVTLDYIIRNLMEKSADWTQKQYILNDRGEIVVNSTEFGRKLEHRLGNDLLQLKPFPFKAVWQNIHAAGNGQLRTEDKIFAFARIPAVNWYYVEESELDKLLY